PTAVPVSGSVALAPVVAGMLHSDSRAGVLPSTTWMKTNVPRGISTARPTTPASTHLRRVLIRPSSACRLGAGGGRAVDRLRLSHVHQGAHPGDLEQPRDVGTGRTQDQAAAVAQPLRHADEHGQALGVDETEAVA